MANDITSNIGEIVIYQTDDGSVQTEVRLVSETLWLSQKMMSELFDKDSDTIGLHLKNIYQEQELDESATTEFFSVVQTGRKRDHGSDRAEYPEPKNIMKQEQANAHFSNGDDL
jgi:hypothetical protein